MHAVSGLLAEQGGNITESQQFGDPETGLFFMRVQFETSAGPEELSEAFQEVADRFSMRWNLDRVGRKMRTIVMGSTAAHCLNDIAFRQRSGLLPIDIAAVVSNHTVLADLTSFYGIAFHHVPVSLETRKEAEAALLSLVEREEVELVILARYMQILSDDLCRVLAGKIINIHHSFLPSFRGARPYAQAHERGVKLIGATAHYVTADLDEGPIIEQNVERVDHAHTEREMIALGQDVERRTLAQAVRWHAERRVLIDGRRTVVFR